MRRWAKKKREAKGTPKKELTKGDGAKKGA
jgi:hypothetical protein